MSIDTAARSSETPRFGKTRIMSVNRQPPAPETSRQFDVMRVTAADNNRVEILPFTLELDIWDRSYDFQGIVGRVEAADKRLSDPTYLAIQVPISILVTHFQHLLVPQLKMLASSHDITFRGLDKGELLRALDCHLCTMDCRSLIYIFKERIRPRTHAPWRQSASVFRLDSAKAPPSYVGAEVAPPETANTQTNDGTASGASTSERHSESRPYNESEFEHLTPISGRRKAEIIGEWQRKMNLENFTRRPCAVCSELKFKADLSTLHGSEIDLRLLRNPELPDHVLPVSYDMSAYDDAILDPEGLADTQSKGAMTVCHNCERALRRGEMPRLALANWLYYARDRLPEAVRRGFEDMSVFEKALVSRVRTNNILCKFTGVDDDLTGDTSAPVSRHIRGNIISTPMDVVRVHSVLPPGGREIADTICALIVATRPPTMSSLRRLKPILVRKSRVKLLIEFLTAFNPHYTQSQGFRGFSKQHLDDLFSGPDDSGLLKHVRIAHMEKNDAVESIVTDVADPERGVEGLFMENVAYTLGDHSPQSYTAMTIHAMASCKKGRPFLYARSGSAPVPDIGNPNWLSWAHPNTDPFGIGGFHHPRRKRAISMEAQLKHLLNMRDPFFERDPVFAFDVYNIIRKDAVNSSLRFRVPYTSYARVVRDIVRTNRDQLSELLMKFAHNVNYKPSTPQELEIVRIMSSISPVAREVPGTVAQRLKMRNEIRALISQKGSPTLFVTINPADFYNPITAVLAKRCKDHEDVQALDDMTLKQRRKIALSHPGACAQFFDIYIKAFLDIILQYRRNENRQGIFGVSNAYYGTVETQGRGTLHCHLLIWLKDHLPPESLKDALQRSPTFRDRLVRWLDSVVDTGFIGSREYLNDGKSRRNTDEELRMMKEPHAGTLPGPSIRAMDEEAFEKEAKEFVDELLLRFNWHEHCFSCWKNLKPHEAKTDANCRFGMDGSVRPSTTIDHETGEILARRRNPRMTQYNPLMTFLLKCNTDVKFIGSGEGAKAFMYYVTDYITKSPMSMHSGLAALSYAIKQAEEKGVLSPDAPEESSTRRMMTMAVNSMLGRQEISHPQVMTFITGTGEGYTSEKFQAVNWGEISKYTQRGVSPDDVPSASLNENALDPEGITVSVRRDGEQVEVSNHLLDYVYRPTEPPFADMGLYRHISWTRKVRRAYPSGVRGPGRTCTVSRQFSSCRHPQYNTHELKMRTEPVVPVLLGPRISRRKGSEAETEEWARDMCILFRPWRHPKELRSGASGWIQSLDAIMPTLDDHDRSVIGNMSLISEGKAAGDERRNDRHNGRTDATTMMEESGESGPPLDGAAEQRGDSTPNAFLLLDPTRYSNDDQRLTHVSNHLQNLIGERSTRAFMRCLPTPTTPGANGNSSSATHTMDDDEEHEIPLIYRQQTYMMSCKHRRTHETTNPTPPSTSRVQDQGGPTADITVAGTDREYRRKVIDGWKTVDDVVNSADLKDNAEQLRAFEIVAHHVLEGGPQLLMYIGGKGGTGKSYLINAIVDLFEKLGRFEELRLGAYTGIAASLIKGSTIHSLLNLTPVNKNTNHRRLGAEWRGVNYLIIDEVSMIGAHFLATINARLKMAKADSSSESEKYFGGINVIFMGDFYQLPPPKQPSLFSHKLVKNPSFLQTRDNRGINAFAGAFLWRQIETAVILRKSKRHCNDPLYEEILEKIRNNKNMLEKGRPSLVAGVPIAEHLRRREIAHVLSRSPSELERFRDAPVIVGSKMVRDALNACLVIAHARRLNETVNLYHAVDLVIGSPPSPALARRLLNLPARATNEAIGLLPLFVGMKVMLTENLSVPFHIVNGSEGVVVAISSRTNERGERFAEAIYVRIPNCELQAPGLQKGIVPIFPTTTSVNYPVRYGEVSAKSFRRRQVPLVPAYSYTDYKSQGRTLQNAIVDLTSAKGQGVYVMLSRVTTLKGLLVLRWFPNARISQRMSAELREEVERLEQIDGRTERLHAQGIYQTSLSDNPMPFDG